MSAFLVVISCLLAGSASGTFLNVPHVTTTQYHSQDELGQYSYGYSGGPSAKEETRTADGVTRGSYSYIDANGIVQSASYVSDPVHGFRVSATNLPQAPSAVVAGPSVVAAGPVYVPAAPVVPVAPAVVAAAPGFDHVNGVPFETPEVIAAKSAHFAAHGQALARLGGRWKRSLVTPASTVVAGPIGKSFSYSTVAAAAPAPVAYSAVSPSSTTVVSGPNGRSFSYSTVAAAPVAPSFSAYSAFPAPAYAYSAPAVVAAPAVTAYSAPVLTAGVPAASQYGAQDGFGQYSYGYSDGLSSKTESRSADGVTHGGYSYLDSNGIVQSVKYIADAGGFRVHATNLPVGPSA